MEEVVEGDMKKLKIDYIMKTHWSAVFRKD